MNQKAITNSTIIKDNPRDYLFDNIRAIFIILVVWGHVLTSMMDKAVIIKIIYYFVFFFHMPAMAFISGYFSKNLDKIRRNAFVTLLIPYLILNAINYVFNLLVIQEPTYGFRFFRPHWGLWYLLALFFWKFFLKDLLEIRFLLPLSFAFAILSGYSKEFSEYMALGRIVSFLPFFLLGYYCTKVHIDKIRRMPKIISFIILVATAILSSYIVINKVFRVEVLYLRRPYPESMEFEFMTLRILVYVVAIVATIAIINLTTDKKTFLFQVGTSTMTVYVLHLFTILILEELELLKNQPYLYLLYSIFMTAAIVYLYTRPVVKRTYDAFMDKITQLFMKTDKADKEIK